MLPLLPEGSLHNKGNEDSPTCNCGIRKRRGSQGVRICEFAFRLHRSLFNPDRYHLVLDGYKDETFSQPIRHGHRFRRNAFDADK